ncbi:MAG: hypothetical protein R3D66_02300 [Alphaproteobacteria bacterium]
MTFDGSGYAVEALEPTEGKGDLMDVVQDLGPEIILPGPLPPSNYGAHITGGGTCSAYPGQ